MTRKSLAGLLAGAAFSTLVATSGAQAQTAASMTTAGTNISNTASFTYTVNGNQQTGSSTPSNFVVDRKVNFTVILDQSGSTMVNAGQQNAVLKFKVTNTTNGTQDFLLDPDQSGIVAGLLNGDNFNMGTLTAYVDSNGNGQYDAGVDTKTYIDELAPDQSATVFLVGNVPTTQGITLARASLHVTAAEGGAANTQGAALASSLLTLTNADGVVDNVFADDDDDGIGADGLHDGQGRAYGAYQLNISNVALTVTKTALVISDPVNLLVNPKPIPGATVQYCLLVNNGTLGTTANAVVLSDIIPTGTTYVPGSANIGVPGGTCVLLGSTNGTAFDGASKTVTANVGDVIGGGSIAAAFQVTIN